MDIPNLLYYSTILFEDGTVETPHYLVFDELADGVTTIKHHYQEKNRYVAHIIMKEALYIDSKVISEDSQILTPTNDFGISEDFRDPIEQQKMVNEAEADNPEKSIMGVLPEEQEDEDLLCRAFFMGPFLKADDQEDYLSKLKRNPFEISQPIDYLLLYRPTGEKKEITVQR